jgi:GTPase SAR1 family protein
MHAREKTSKVHKLLLLGPGNSGKSTFYKQLSSLHGKDTADSFDEFKHTKKQTIHDSIMDQLKNLIQMAELDFDLEGTFEGEVAEAIAEIKKFHRDNAITADVAENIATIWSDKEIKHAFENRCNLGVVDSLSYFLDAIHRFAVADYTPSERDILLARIPTTGIRSKTFDIKGAEFELFDVGGQKSERGKWIHCFETVHAVLFVVSLSCYDQMLYEDIEINAMQESLQLWDETANSPYFDNGHTAMIVFFNKSDLFKEKIERVPITACFKDFDGEPNDYTQCINFIMLEFTELVENEEEALYTHITCATDKENVKAVFADVQHRLVMGQLNDHGII